VFREFPTNVSTQKKRAVRAGMLIDSIKKGFSLSGVTGLVLVDGRALMRSAETRSKAPALR
jgi:hypothetical protein